MTTLISIIQISLILVIAALGGGLLLTVQREKAKWK
jgi:hypothetical protein